MKKRTFYATFLLFLTAIYTLSLIHILYIYAQMR